MNLGYIGSGPISNFHIPAIKNNGFNIAAIGSRKSSSRCELFAKKQNLTNVFCKYGWEEVLSKDLDAYAICIDVEATITVLEQALATRKPIFVEKPINTNPNKLIKYLNDPNIDNVFVGFNRRFYETVNIVKNICCKAKGGTIYLNMPDSEYGFKRFINNGCHMIDILRFLVGEFEIIGKTKKINTDFRDMGSFSALCKNEKWDILINAHSQIPANFSITINTDKSVYELKPIEKLSHYHGIDILEPTKEEPIRKYIPHLKKSYIEGTKFKPGFDSMYRNFRLFVEGKSSSFCDFKDAYCTLNLCWELINPFDIEL
tara:strand:- start:3356 stop:4303 length:948 start_codon:yes stop_codon:yes gene_type:complete